MKDAISVTFYGSDSIPEIWKDILEDKKYLIELSDKLYEIKE